MAEETKTLDDLKDLAQVMPPPETVAAIVEPQKDAQGRSYATGKRKDAVARVWIRPGSGAIIVNGRDQVTYFARPVLRMLINQPFAAADREGLFDVMCTVKGGGPVGAGGGGAPRHLEGADPVRAGAPRRPEERRLPDPRRPGGRAQEVRPAQGPTKLPVLQAVKLQGVPIRL